MYIAFGYDIAIVDVGGICICYFQVLPWRTVGKQDASVNLGATSVLQQFADPIRGRLVGTKAIIATSANSLTQCAHMCIGNPKCLSFDYDPRSKECETKDVLQGYQGNNGIVLLRRSYFFYHYERLSVGNSWWVEYDNLNLEHGVLYVITGHFENAMKFKGYVNSNGTVADFTPPNPGPVGRTLRDDITHDACAASILQRCHDVTILPNHR